MSAVWRAKKPYGLPLHAHTSSILKLKNLDHFLRSRHSQVLKAVNTLATQPPMTASRMKAQI